MSAVKPSKAPNQAKALRRAIDDADLSKAAVAREMGCGRSYICDVSRSDRRPKPISDAQWKRVWQAFNRAIIRREG